MEDNFGDVDGGGYGDVSPFADVSGGSPFTMDTLQSLQTGAYEDFISASSAASPAPLPSSTATVTAGSSQMRIQTQQLQLTPRGQQQQLQVVLRAQQARQMQILQQQQQQQQQQQTLGFRDQQNQWAGPAAMEEQMRALMEGGVV
ncbi:hypothetical protein VE01_09563 [Pseudogymnoascus verrucosus]|uniref:Uncharacterized protein n=1 Tax=Pseudogymnoascus verrucosus TaxID=342668 RepID=A0A1B8G9F6_9PEZI|nr:uncharacterized protein VE01_09563 [Pseudogymnoascus verrucosus]OBT92441.1 hypothetical protein VE01_09563 [Pseudogymnoascus verrucosus]